MTFKRKNDNGELSLPPLVLIGDRELLSPYSPCDDIEDLKKSEEDSAIKSKLQELKKCQKFYGGIGIAACQVGWRTRIFCMGIESDDKAAMERYPAAGMFEFQYWVNPTVTPEPESGTSWFWEGCLSVPGMRGWVKRPNAIKLSGYDEHGQYKEVELDGLPARVAQHEYDHLDGILFPDRSLQGTLLPTGAFADDRQDRWPENWPTPGSRQTKPGGFSRER